MVLIYNWIDLLKKQRHYINGNVIMPNIQVEMRYDEFIKT